ncbi:hypothetical protein CCACVL1_31008 [Corchorus capsularis]|uniref:Uncharacterized protein n=1 Tax=Corchorus capsularis TaxID=210143 RepID=A0A1R3FU81_COCAP|nr:hypothetical protein CCACVL1_31008 [Corchorus capsularis]
MGTVTASQNPSLVHHLHIAKA